MALFPGLPVSAVNCNPDYTISFSGSTFDGTNTTFSYEVSACAGLPKIKDWILGLPDCVTLANIDSAGPGDWEVKYEDAAGLFGLKFKQDIPSDCNLVTFYVTLIGNWPTGVAQTALHPDRQDWCQKTTQGPVCPVLLTLAVSPAGAGTTSPVVGVHTYGYGDVVAIEASPSMGWKFDRWESDVTGSTNPDSVTMNGAKSVTAVFDHPVDAVDDTYSTTEDTPRSVPTPGVIANDSILDGGESVTLVSDVSHGTLSLGSNGSFTYLPDLNSSGSDSFVYELSDGDGDSDTATTTISITAVNDAPVIGDIPAQTIDKGDTFTTVILDAYVSDVDNTDAEMTWSYSGNSELTVTIDGNHVATIGIPNADWYGSETITFRATDPGSLFDEESAAFTVTALNDLPVANDDSDTTPEDTPVTTNVAANDTDVDGTVVPSTVAIASGPSNGSVVNNGDGTVTYMPNADFSGSDTYTYTLRDNNGAPSNAATVTIAIGPVNDPPIANDDTVLTDENASILIEVTLNDSDPDGTIDPATIMIADAPVSGTVQVAGDGTITYSPNLNFGEIDQFTYTVKDNEGATSNVAMVIVTVVRVNDPPIAEDDVATTKSGVPVSIAILTNDSVPDDNLVPGTVTMLSEPENGTATVNWDGTITYSSIEGFVGTDQFTYRVQDVHDAISNEATVTVEVLNMAGEGGNKFSVQEPVPSAGFLKRDTDVISLLVLSEPEENEGIYYILTAASTVLEELALSADIQPTTTRAGALLEVKLEFPEEERKSRGWPWVRVTQPDLAEFAGGGETGIGPGYSFSGRCANGLYWLGIDTSDLWPGRYNFWIVYGEGKTLLVPILVLP